MLGVDQGKEIDLQDAVYLYTPMIPGLRGPGTKMSSSVSGSFISIRDKKEDIVYKINKAYCKAGDVENNPVLSIAKLVIFPKFEKLEINRDKKYGGKVMFKDYKELEKAFESQELHAGDLKKAVVEYLEKIIAPIRKNWK